MCSERQMTVKGDAKVFGSRDFWQLTTINVQINANGLDVEFVITDTASRCCIMFLSSNACFQIVIVQLSCMSALRLAIFVLYQYLIYVICKSEVTVFILQVGLVFLFNLIVGTGALAIPKAFGKAGWLVGTIVITLLAFFR